ncbi:MAG: hypothetical protein ABSF90_25250 [Syntrophobacteraceae bacterium]
MTKKVRVAPNLAISGPFRSGAAVAPSEERCADLHAPRGAALCLTRLRVWQKSRGSVLDRNEALDSFAVE